LGGPGERQDSLAAARHGRVRGLRIRLLPHLDYYRTSTRTTGKKIYYYRCMGSDDYGYKAGRACGNTPVHPEYLDQVVWGHVSSPDCMMIALTCRLRSAPTAS
jgi:hypothetical protein